MAKKKPAPEATTPGLDYTVLARRCRPQQFTDLVGQEATAQALINALKSNRVAHAYLFTGPRGVGKTSTARILAKALNCVQGPTATPCDSCDACQAIAVGEDVDVLEIDGASNNKVEEVRELRQNVQYRPSRSRFKIYIIDEVHMLTTAAFNALLKTLEEPPPHVKFIFATTEVQKVPLTIVSRCQRFDFVSIQSQKIRDHLQRLVEAEGVDADAEALDLVARRAGGSMRDAQSLLDQLLAFSDDRITVPLVHQLLGTASEETVAALAAAILDREVPQALEVLNRSLDQGVQVGELLDQLVAYWRDLMLVRTAGSDFDGLTFSRRYRDTMQHQAQQLHLDAILAGLDMMANAKARLRTTNYGRILLEMLLVRLAHLENLAPLSELVEALRSGKTPSLGTNRPAPMPQRSVPRKPTARAADANPPPTEVKAEAPLPLTNENLEQVWQRALGKLGTTLAEELRMAATPLLRGTNCLVLRFGASYTTERKRCESSQQRIATALKQVVGHDVALRFEQEAGDSTGNDDQKLPPMQRRRQDAARDPLVRQAMELCDAQLIQVDDDFGTDNAEPTGNEEG